MDDKDRFASSLKSLRPLQRADAICDRFEAHWQAEQEPKLDEFLSLVPDGERSTLFVELLKLEIDYRSQRNEFPNEESLTDRFPGYRSEVRKLFVDEAPRSDTDLDRLSQTMDMSHSKSHGSGGFIVPPSGIQFASYQLIDEIARGGMGVVYRARQVEADRIVALKMILNGSLAGQREVERFKAEAKAAASLDHPNIVPIFDVGEQDQHHYFSMGYVSGPSLKQFLKSGLPGPRRSAAMVQAIAEAIDYAHSKGVIHRDLKPANVLIASGGNPKITDFGLSKVAGSQAELTGTGQLLGTPAYMSPEQASGTHSDVGPQTDVYSIGAILYEMITGQVPFEAETTLGLLEKVRSQAPASPRTLNSEVDPDIETICLKCLEKSPSHRYPSARSLAGDLGRYLRGEPIQARPITRLQKVGRWCKSRPAIARLAGCLALTLLLFGSTTVYFAVTSAKRGSMLEENYAVALSAVNQMVKQAEILSDVPRTGTQRRELLSQATEFYAKFLAQRPNDVQLRFDVAQVHHSVGDIFRFLGGTEASKSAYLEAIDLLEALVQQDPNNLVYTEQLRESHIWLGELLARSEPDQALRVTNQAFAIQAQINAISTNFSANEYGTARVLYNRGRLQFERGEFETAERDFRTATERLRTLVAGEHSLLADHRLDLGRTLSNFGNLLKATGRAEEAKASFEEAIRLHASRTDLGREERTDLGIFRNNLSNTLASLGEVEKALVENDQAIVELQRLVVEFPLSGSLKSELANALNSRGALVGRHKSESISRDERLASAAEYFGRAEATLSELVEGYPDQIGYFNRLGTSSYNLAAISFMQKDHAEVIDRLGAAIKRHLQAHSANPENEEYLRNLRNDYSLLLRSLLADQRMQSVLGTLDEYLRLFENDGQSRLFAAKTLASGYKTLKESPSTAEARERLLETFGERATSELRIAFERGESRAALEKEGALVEPFRSLDDRKDFKELIDAWR